MCHKMTLTNASTDKKKLQKARQKYQTEKKFEQMESQKLLTEEKKLY